MKFLVSNLKFCLIAVCLFNSIPGRTNSWIDENFDDGLAFDASNIDTYSENPPANPGLTFTNEQGSLTTARAYNGTHSYELNSGENLSVSAGNYENPADGPFQYFQFAVSVSQIPVSTGSIGTFRWNFSLEL